MSNPFYNNNNYLQRHAYPSIRFAEWNGDIHLHVYCTAHNLSILCSILTQSVLLYGAEGWIPTNQETGWSLNRAVTYSVKHLWQDHKTNYQINRNIPLVSQTLLQRWLRFSRYCWRSKQETAQLTLLWEPQNGKRSRGSPATTFVGLITTTSLYTVLYTPEGLLAI